MLSVSSYCSREAATAHRPVLTRKSLRLRPRERRRRRQRARSGNRARGQSLTSRGSHNRVSRRPEGVQRRDHGRGLAATTGTGPGSVSRFRIFFGGGFRSNFYGIQSKWV